MQPEKIPSNFSPFEVVTEADRPYGIAVSFDDAETAQNWSVFTHYHCSQEENEPIFRVFIRSVRLPRRGSCQLRIALRSMSDTVCMDWIRNFLSDGIGAVTPSLLSRVSSANEKSWVSWKSSQFV